MKSKEAEEFIQKSQLLAVYNLVKEETIKAISISEQELEEKTIEAHRKCCSFYDGGDGGDCKRKGSEKPCNWIDNSCDYMQRFINELNK